MNVPIMDNNSSLSPALDNPQQQSAQTTTTTDTPVRRIGWTGTIDMRLVTQAVEANETALKYYSERLRTLENVPVRLVFVDDAMIIDLATDSDSMGHPIFKPLPQVSKLTQEGSTEVLRLIIRNMLSEMESMSIRVDIHHLPPDLKEDPQTCAQFSSPVNP
jgi:hypothetical protein